MAVVQPDTVKHLGGLTGVPLENRFKIKFLSVCLSIFLANIFISPTWGPLGSSLSLLAPDMTLLTAVSSLLWQLRRSEWMLVGMVEGVVDG